MSASGERRKAKIRMQAMKRAYNKATVESAKTKLLNDMMELSAVSENSYTYNRQTGKKNKDVNTVNKNVKRMKELNSEYTRYVHGQKAINKTTTLEINKSTNSNDLPSEFNEAQTHYFYAKTKSEWMDRRLEERNDAILEAYGEVNLNVLFKEIVNTDEAKEYIYYYDVLNNKDEYTEDEIKKAEEYFYDNQDAGFVSPPKNENENEAAKNIVFAPNE